jgi:hypothetical protein
MKIVQFAIIAVVCLICCEFANAQYAQYVTDPRFNFHAGVHSGSWTLKREQLLAEESKDPYRSCPDPYCSRCAKHLADYGHEYQYLSGPMQQQLWYRGTDGRVGIVTQRGYDQHGLPYALHGNPAAASVPWEYMQTLNHAIWEQVNARNAVALEEAARDRVIMLTQLLADAKEQLRLTKEAWQQVEPHHWELVGTVVKPCGKIITNNVRVVRCTKTYKQFCIEMKAGRYEVACVGLCPYCLAQWRYAFDLAYVADVEKELALAHCHLAQRSAVATEAVRVALLSKDDADRATRIKRLQYKPPKYKEVLAAMGDVADEQEPEEDEIEP